MTVIHSNQQSTFVTAEIVRWMRGEEDDTETLVMEKRLRVGLSGKSQG